MAADCLIRAVLSPEYPKLPVVYTSVFSQSLGSRTAASALLGGYHPFPALVSSTSAADRILVHSVYCKLFTL